MKEAATSGQQLSLSLTLSHEARRDGIADGNRAETREATLAHTEMALRMLGDGATSSIMKEVIDASENLQMDLGKYMTAKLRGDDTLFDKYVDGTYDSSADYWRLIKNENGEYGFAWDGNLNIYGEDGNRTDRNAGLLLDYREIQGVLDKDKGKTKITLAEDIEVNYGALETVQGINQTIIASSVWDRSMATIAGGGKSGAGAADALLGDGFMSEDETIDAAGRVLSRYASSRLGLTMIEHYSVRSVFDEMGQALFDGREIMSDIPTSFGLFNGDGLMGRLMGEFSDRYHEMGNERRSDDFLEGNGNDKYVRPYGGESILSGTTYEVVLNMFGEVVTDPVNRGTFNFAPETGHFNLDMVPYYKWGNDPIDRLTTTLIDRVLGVYRGPIPKGIF
jgi:hypothetical protein